MPTAVIAEQTGREMATPTTLGFEGSAELSMCDGLVSLFGRLAGCGDNVRETVAG
jgi:hypothetical protein